MTTAYNFRNKMYRSSAADRAARLDPGAGGTIIVTPVDRATVKLVGAGLRTLEAAANIGVGTSILVISATDGVTVSDGSSTVYMNANEWGVAHVVENTAGTHSWVLFNASTQNNTNIELPIADARVHDAAGTLLTVAAGATDDMGINAGTYGTTGLTLNSLDVGGGGETFYARFPNVIVPTNYIQGQVLSLVANVTEVVACGTSATLDFECYRSADAPATDLVATAVQSIVGATATDYVFTLTSTAIQAGDRLDIRVKTVLTNAAGDRGDYDINSIRLTSYGA